MGKTRLCVRCKNQVPIKQFRLRGASAGYRYGLPYGACKPCIKKGSAEITSHTAIYIKDLCRNRGAKSSHDWDICTLEVLLLWYLQDGRCAITNRPMTTQRGMDAVVPTNLSIDRIDNREGYHWENIHLVCDIVNRMKHSLSMNELYDWCEAVIGTTNR